MVRGCFDDTDPDSDHGRQIIRPESDNSSLRRPNIALNVEISDNGGATCSDTIMPHIELCAQQILSSPA